LDTIVAPGAHLRLKRPLRFCHSEFGNTCGTASSSRGITWKADTKSLAVADNCRNQANYTHTTPPPTHARSHSSHAPHAAQRTTRRPRPGWSWGC